MENYKFRLSNILPNVWFYTLRDMGKARSTSKKKQPTSTIEQQQKICSKTKQPHHRKSYYFTRELAKGNERNCNSSKTDIKEYSKSHSPKDTPRKSSEHKAAKRRAMLVKTSHSNKCVNSSVLTGCRCRCRKKSDNQELDISTYSPEMETEFRSDNALPTESFEKMLSLSNSCVCKIDSSSDKDIIINIDKNSLSNKFSLDMLPEPELPPIITKSVKCKNVKKNNAMDMSKEPNADDDFHVEALNAKNNAPKGVRNIHVKRFSGNHPGVRLRVNSPRIAGRKIIQHAHSRKSISSSSSSSRISLRSSYAVVKSSCDPQRDFKQSMLEMIVENNMKSSKDLEDLLACYISLNSDEYHEIIIRVFKDIWCDLFDSLK